MRHKGLLIVSHEKFFAFLDDLVALGFEMGAQEFNAAGILRIQFATGFQSAPVRGDAFASFRGGFGSGMRGDPGEDAGGDGAADFRAVLAGEGGAEFIDGDEFSFRHLLHQGIDLARRGDDESGAFPAGAIGRSDVHDFGQVLVIGEFFTPGLAWFHRQKRIVIVII